jgi:hypothetical protein
MHPLVEESGTSSFRPPSSLQRKVSLCFVEVFSAPLPSASRRFFFPVAHDIDSSLHPKLLLAWIVLHAL